jgi:hypothetical protein
MVRFLLLLASLPYCNSLQAYTFHIDESSSRTAASMAALQRQQDFSGLLLNRYNRYTFYAVYFIQSDTSIIKNENLQLAFYDDFSYEAVALQLLVWTRLENPEVRKTYMYNWARGLLDDLPTTETAALYISELCRSRKKQEIQDRIKEYKEISLIINKENKYMKKTMSISRPISINTNCPEIDALASRLNPFRASFFDLDKEKRKELYESFPKKSPSLEEYPHFDILWLLWLFEPERDLRRDCLLPLLIQGLFSCPKFIIDQCEDGQKKDRLEELEMLQKLKAEKKP